MPPRTGLSALEPEASFAAPQPGPEAASCARIAIVSLPRSTAHGWWQALSTFCPLALPPSVVATDARPLAKVWALVLSPCPSCHSHSPASSPGTGPSPPPPPSGRPRGTHPFLSLSLTPGCSARRWAPPGSDPSTLNAWHVAGRRARGPLSQDRGHWGRAPRPPRLMSEEGQGFPVEGLWGGRRPGGWRRFSASQLSYLRSHPGC